MLHQIALNTGKDIPGYASGGDFSGGWRVVGERGPELEFTGASSILSNKKSKSLLNTDELVAEVRLLRAEINKGNFAMASNTAKTAKILSNWDGNGQPSDRGW